LGKTCPEKGLSIIMKKAKWPNSGKETPSLVEGGEGGTGGTTRLRMEMPVTNIKGEEGWHTTSACQKGSSKRFDKKWIAIYDAIGEETFSIHYGLRRLANRGWRG